MPHLFGPLGKTSIGGNLLRVMCMRKEFRVMATDASSPVADWLRLLCREVRDSRGVEGVGVIGMCLTGNFAITLIGDDSVLAAVASQPAMPFFKQGELHMSPQEIASSREALETKGAMRSCGSRMILFYYREVRVYSPNLQYRWSRTHKRNRVTGQRSLCPDLGFR